ncbi:MAG: hypothetical protein GPI95_10035 [Microcystis aeruginosa LG13-11]|nr:hypothetical protein [Microcystis aeruginosa LG13-11]
MTRVLSGKKLGKWGVGCGVWGGEEVGKWGSGEVGCGEVGKWGNFN